MCENFVVHPEYTHRSKELRNILSNFSNIGEYIVAGERNDIKKVNLDEITLNIKKFKSPNLFQALVYRFIRKSKARRSYEYALRLLDADISTPFPIAYLEVFSGGLRESYYISEHLDYDFDFRTLIHNPRFENRDEILKQFTAFTFKLHENDVNFLDHSPGNTLIVQRDANRYDFYLIDLNRMRFESMDFKKRMRNFRRLWLSKTMIRIMAKEYAKLYGTDEQETRKLMSHYSRTFQKAKNSKKLRRRRGRR